MRRQLRLRVPEIEILAIATAPGQPIDAAEEFSFRMRAAFARALAALNLTTARPKRRRASTGVPLGQPNTDELYEGAIYRSQITRWERNREARRQCIAHFGPICQACKFSFAKRYGALGAAFIEVHHTTVYAARQERRQVDPLVDLVPVCSNCHRMLHRRDPPLGIRALKRHLGLDV
jgi:5-methylcytosine-specific restriction protein A